MDKNKKVRSISDVTNEIAQFEKQVQQSNRNAKLLYRDYAGNTLNTNIGEQSSPANYNKSQRDSETTSWYEDAFNFISTPVKGAYNVFSEDIPNSWRMLIEKINQGHTSTTEDRMRENNDNKRNAEIVQEYINLLEKYKELKDVSNVSGGVMFRDQITLLENELKKYDDYFKGDGRHNSLVADLMYRMPTNLGDAELSKISDTFITRGLYGTDKQSVGDWSIVKNILKYGIINPLTAISHVAELGYMKLFNEDEALKQDAVKNVDNSNEGRAVIDALYDGRNIYNLDDLKKRLNYWNIHTERLDNLYDKWYRADKEREKEGLLRIKIPFTDTTMSFDISDSEDVSPEWRQLQLIHAGEFWSHPWYTLPEVGSTIGLGAGMVGTMVSDGIARMVIRELPTMILTPEAKILASAKMLKNPAAILRATKMLEQAKAASNAYQLTKAGILSADISTGLWLTAESRRQETAQESSEAAKQRLIKILDDSSANPEVVYNSILKNAKRLNVNTDNMTPDELIGFALAYDFDTEDPVFEQGKKDVQKGLMKLINANNALAVVDYLATLPFLGFGERVLSDFARIFSDGLYRAGVTFPRFTGWLEKGMWKALKDNYKYDVNLVRNMEQLSPVAKLYVKYGAAMDAAYEGRVYKFAEDLMKKNHRTLGLSLNHIAKWSVSTFPKYAHTAFFEGLEEGQQEILQKRYQRGEYDDYTESYSMFDIPEVFNNIEIGKDAIKAWFGILGEDDDDIRKASLIGASASMFFPFVGRAINSTINTHDNHFLNLVGQLRTDWAMRRLISDNYRTINDHNHMSMYYDAFRKGGVDNIRMRRALNNLKLSLDLNSTFATPEYVEDDIQLMENVWTAYKDNQFANDLAVYGIKKFSPEYKTAVLNYARALTDLYEDNVGILKEDKNKLEFEGSVLKNVMDFINPSITEEQKNAIVDEMPEIKSIARAFKELYSIYKTQFEAQVQSDKEKAPNIKLVYLANMMSMSAEQLLADKDFYNALEDYFIQTGELVDKNLSANKQFISRNIYNIINNESLFESISKNAMASHFREQENILNNALVLDEDDYIQRLANYFSLYQLLKRAQAMRIMFDDREETLKNSRLITGRDINTDRLKGMISGINDLISAIEKEEKEIFGRNGRLNEMFEDLDLVYPNQKRYNSILDALMFHTALSNPHRKIVSAYIYNRLQGAQRITPAEFIDAIYGNIANTGDPLYDKLVKISDEYKQLISLQTEESSLGLKQGSAEERDLFIQSKKAASAIIMDEIRLEEKRSRIAHKKYEEEAREILQNQENTQEEQEPIEQQTPVEENPTETENLNKDDKLVLDPDLEEDSIVGTLDNEGEETRRRRLVLNRIEEAERRRREQELLTQELQLDEELEILPDEDNQPLVNEESNEVILVSLPINEGLIQRLAFGGKIYTLESFVTTSVVINDSSTTRYKLILKENGNEASDVDLQFCVYTDTLGENYQYSDDDDLVKGIIFIDVTRSKVDGQLNSPNFIQLYDKDGVEIGHFIRKTIELSDDSIINESEEDNDNIPTVFPEQEAAPVITGEDQIPTIPDNEEIPIVTGSIDESQFPVIGEQNESQAPVVGQEDESNVPVVGREQAPITVDNIDYVPEVGFVDQFGIPLTEQELIGLQNQDSILADIEFYKKMSKIGQVPKNNSKENVEDERDASDYISQTLFFQPDSEKPIDLKIGSENISLKYPLKSGKELAQKLLDHNWLQNCYKYFVVTQALDAAHGAPNDPDSFTVAMIIEDELDKASYAVTYRQLGKYLSKGIRKVDGQEVEEEYPVNHELELIDFLMSVHGQGIGTKERVKNYYDELYSIIAKKKFLTDKIEKALRGESIDEADIIAAKTSARSWVRNKPSKKRQESDEEFEVRRQKYDTELDYYKELARDNIARKNSKKIPVSEINKQIQLLREARMKIINLYLHHYEKDGNVVYEFPKASDTKRTVIATGITLSNGKFDNLTEDGQQPVYGNLSKDGNPFGIKHSAQEISRQIEENEIILGVGLGEINANNAYKIVDFRRNLQQNLDIEKGGLAGKIYLVIDTPNGNKVPLMLLEQRFDRQYNNDNTWNSAILDKKLKLCLDVDGSIIDSSVKPSASEVLVYLLLNAVNNRQFSGLTPELQSLFANLFIHNGEKTILKNSRVEDQLPFYAAKQLLVVRRADGKHILIIGLPELDKDGMETGRYRQTAIKYDELFDPSDDLLRRRVVRAIARNMHWNTNRDAMAQTFGGSETKLIINYLEDYFKNNPTEEEYSLFGVPEFTFKKTDLFETDSTGTPLKLKEGLTVAGWMIKNGKLSTDVSDNIFKNPWVFTSGKQQDTSADSIITGENNAIKTGTGDIDITRTILELSGNEQNTSLNLFDEEKYKGLPGILKDKKVVKELPDEELPKKILISDPEVKDSKYQDSKQFANYIKSKLQAIADEMNSSGKYSVKITLPENIDERLNNGGLQMKLVQDRYSRNSTYKIYPYVTINANGTMVLLFSNYARTTGATVVNGVYQTRKSSGIMDRQSALKWLLDKLGVPEYDVLFTDMVMTSVENGEPVYGVMNVAFDTLREEFTGNFKLNPIGGRGLHYHEAWHYVNLLLHDQKTQRRIFDAYAESHPEYKGKLNIEIEEALAEEFRKFMELRDTNGIINNVKGIIKRFFYAVADTLHLSGNKAEYRSIFRKINKGLYKKQSLSLESLQEFLKFYKNGVYSLYLPGYNKSLLDNLAVVENNDDFLIIADAIGEYILNSVEIRTVDDLKSLCAENFSGVILELGELNKTDDVGEDVKPIILTFLDNPEAIRKVIMDKLKDFGIIAKKDSISKAREEEEKEDEENISEDEPWNIFDKFQFTVSKKQNAAFLAKLFMHRIPMKHWVPQENGNPILEDTPNEIIPVIPKTVSYDEVWNALTEEFKNLNNEWGVKDKDGRYPRFSFRGIVQKKVDERDPLFVTIDSMLDDIEDDTQLKAQLLSTLNSQKPNISFFELVNRHRLETELERAIKSGEISITDIDLKTLDEDRAEADAFAVADRNKKWDLKNDNTLRAARSIPRRWSNRILSYGIIDYNNEGKISKTFYKSIINQYDNIISELNEYFGKKRKSELDKELKIYEIKDSLVKLLQSIGVEADEEVLNFYLYSKIGRGNISPETQATEIRKMLDMYTNGTFGYVINLIKTNTGNTDFSKKTRKKGKFTKKVDLDRALKINELFTGTALSSVITKFALARFAMHPGSAEYGVRDASGNMLYPTSQNNFISSKQRLLNTTGGEEARKMLRDPYAQNSLILKLAKDFDMNIADEDQIKFNVHVGLRGKVEGTGSDYFGITSIEDYIIKMILLDQDPEYSEGNKNNESTHLILPTMADKKTYGDISNKQLRTCHDPFVGVLTESQEVEILFDAWDKYIRDPYALFVESDEDDLSEDVIARQLWINNLSDEQKLNYIEDYKRRNKKFNRYSDKTLKIFANYFLDEINALVQYYSKDNIKFLLNNPSKLKKNFHGSIDENGRLSFSGNGGLFRYFYDSVHTGIFDKTGNEMNLNQMLEFLYNLEKLFIENDSEIKLEGVSETADVQNMSLSAIDPNATEKKDLDGFELIRTELDRIKDRLFETVYDNNKPVGIQPREELLTSINEHLVMLLEDELQAMCSNPNIELAKKVGNRIIPVAIPFDLLERQFNRFKKEGILSGKYIPYSKKGKSIDEMMLKSLVANHVVNTIISIIEFEKVFLGDPSYFKYSYLKYEGDFVTTDFQLSYTLPNGDVVNTKQSVKTLVEKETDKIKRLGSLLSPGDELLLQYTEEDYKKYKNLPRGDRFTNMIIGDISARSQFMDNELIPRIKRLLLVDYIRTHNFEPIQEYVKKVLTEKGKNNFDLERAINLIYSDFKIQTENGKQTLFDYLYEKLDDINKSIIDKRTILKTKPFGKINVADAQVLIRPAMYRKVRIGLGKWTDEDEEAYWILETDSSWMTDPEKAEKVSKLELFPLKMAYYSNDPEEYESLSFNTPTLGKQAIFPWFKFAASTEVGEQIYNRMNKKGSEIDFLSFDSAVKVGAPQNQVSPYKKGVTTLGKINDLFEKESNSFIDENGNVNTRNGDVLPVLVLDLKYLRYQLNTQAHSSHERAIGTLMFKISFSNIIDTEMYGRGISGRQPRLGSNMKRSIMRNISLLTKIGAQTIEDEFYRNGEVDQSTIKKWTRRIIENNGLGDTADDIIRDGFIAESLMNRKTFELAISKLVNKEVVDISTNGGTAVQQSTFGFTSFDGSEVTEWDKKTYHKYNDGKTIKWLSKNNSLLVLLSANFFKSVVPTEYSHTYDLMRDWLIEHNIIGDKANPFGLGYRIPTQGQSSIFVFQVADIIPEQHGDVIVVPPEFTAQTGSDFDVDKLFLATFAYEDGQYSEIDDELYEYYTTGKGDVTKLCGSHSVYWKTDFKRLDLKESDTPYYKDRAKFLKDIQRQKNALKKLMPQYKKAIQNRLLWDYIDILSDDRMFSVNRGSIDVISDIIHDDILSWLDPRKTNYLTGMYELTPSFQAMKKLEFSVGKDGISAFALNITNLALTQCSHLTIDYAGNNPYGLHGLDEIRGEDWNYIADWLSGMVNACVDVAKDPYIFTLNVNNITFNHINFLLRSGKGASTFTFMSLPIIKQYAAKASVSGGIYGNNITGRNTENESKRKKNRTIRFNLMRQYLKDIKELRSQFSEEEWKKVDDATKNAYAETILYLEYNYDLNKTPEQRSKMKVKGKVPSLSHDSVFYFEEGKKQILNYTSDNKADRIASYLYQIKVMRAFLDIEPHAENMSNLVQLSQIDTKKFGNDIIKQINYDARIKIFKYTAPNWIINTTTKERENSRMIPGYALEKYYSTMFLEEKFKLAKKYTKQLLSGLLLVATDEFEKLFSSIAKEINGEVEYKIPQTRYNEETKRREYITETTKNGKKLIQTKTVTTFNPFYSEDTLESISQAINNIARFNIIMNSGLINNLRALPGRDDGRQYETAIDFSFGGSFSELIKGVNRLMFGDDVEKSVPARVFDFISNILKNPESKDAEGIVEDGKIINDFLKYLQPLIKTPETPIDRFVLSDSLFRVSKNKKNVLAASWYSLLTHPSENVRKLARDVAVYSYYTTYDTPSINSITDLIPIMFRSMYDQALKDAIHGNNPRLGEFLSLGYFTNQLQDDTKKQFSETVKLSDLYLDIISKNYYYDDDIVPSYTEHGRGSINHSAKRGVEYRDVRARLKSGSSFSGIIITDNVPNTPMYFKIRKNSDTMLYKRIGVVVKSLTIKKGKEKSLRKVSALGAYVAVQKAGYHGKFHVFEFYANLFIPSLFKQLNAMPERFVRSELVQNIVDTVDKWNNDSSKYQYEFVNEEEVTLDLFSDAYNSLVYNRKTGGEFEDPFVNDSDMYYRTEKSKKYSPWGYKFASDVILSFNKKQDEYDEKTIYFGKNDNFTNVIDEYITKNKLSGGITLTVDSDIQLFEGDNFNSLTLNKESAFYPSEKEIDDYINTLIDSALLEELKRVSNMTQSDMEDFRREQKEFAKQFNLERNVAIQKLATAIVNVLRYIQIKHPDVKILQIRMNNATLDTIAAIAVQKAQKEDIQYKMLLKVDRSVVGTDLYRDFMNLYKSNIGILEEGLYTEYLNNNNLDGILKMLEVYIPEEVEDEGISDLETGLTEDDLNDLGAMFNPDEEITVRDVEEEDSGIQNPSTKITEESNNTKEHENC